MKPIIYGLMTTFIATMLVVNVYAIAPEDQIKGARASLIADEVVGLLKDVNDIMDTCTLQATFGIVSDSCLNFITDIRDSLKLIVTNTNVTMTDSDFDKLIQSMNSKTESGITSYP